VTLFADPDSYAPGTLGSSIVNTAGTFESIWDVADNSAFGITGLVCGSVIKSLPGEQGTEGQNRRNYPMNEFAEIDEAVRIPHAL
jgi:hypothetical protein